MQIKAPSLETCVTPETPPTFVFSTFEDNVVPIENSLLYLRALEENDVPFETHLFKKANTVFHWQRSVSVIEKKWSIPVLDAGLTSAWNGWRSTGRSHRQVKCQLRLLNGPLQP